MAWHEITRSKIVTFRRVIILDIAFRMIPNIAWFTHRILIWWDLETDRVSSLRAIFVEITSGRPYRETAESYRAALQLNESIRITKFYHCYHIHPWLCVWDVCYIIFCYLLHTHSGKTGNLFSLLLCSVWWVQIIGYVLSWRSYSFVCTLHRLIIIIVQTYLKTLNF